LSRATDARFDMESARNTSGNSVLFPASTLDVAEERFGKVPVSGPIAGQGPATMTKSMGGGMPGMGAPGAAPPAKAMDQLGVPSDMPTPAPPSVVNGPRGGAAQSQPEMTALGEKSE